MRIRHCPRVLHSQLRRYWFVTSAALLTALSAYTSDAGPLIIEESARLTAPDPSYDNFPVTVAVGGNSAIVGGTRPAVNPEFPDQFEMAAFLYERNSAGAWPFVRTLTVLRSNEAPAVPNYEFNVAMNSLVAVVMSGQARVFERTAAGWVSVPAAAGAQNGDVEVHSGQILASHIAGTCADATLIQKSAGTWTNVRNFSSTVPPEGEFLCDVDANGGDVDVANNRVIVSQIGNNSTDVQIWSRNPGEAWPARPTAIVPLPGPASESGFSLDNGQFVAIDADDAIASSGSRLLGPHLLRRSGTWSVVGNLQRPDRAMVLPPRGLELLNGFAAVGYTDSAGIFQRNSTGGFDYVAKLVASDGVAGGTPEISGRRVIATGTDTNGRRAAYLFDLPVSFAQPALIQDDFEDRNLAEWTPIAGSVASVVSNGLSFFYRQTSTAGAAGATRTGVDMKNQSIEADVVIRSFATGSGDRWAGLTVRQTDTGNYYYLTLRNTSMLSLRKLENGVIRELSSVPVSFSLTTRHKVRLEAIGTQIRGYVDGQLRVAARDTTHKNGTPGIRMFRTAADYDNVVISPNPQTTLLFDDFEQSSSHPQWWNVRAGVWSETVDGSTVFAQNSLAAGGRVTTDLDADDQVVQVRAKASLIATGDPWFGPVARFQDDGNFYYLAARTTGTVQLRRLVNGQITVLDEAAAFVPVNTGTWYTLRLEVVGNSLRGYLNEQPLVEAKDSTFASGTYGLATNTTSARFDNVRVTQP